MLAYRGKRVFIYQMPSSFLVCRAFPVTVLNEAPVLFSKALASTYLT